MNTNMQEIRFDELSKIEYRMFLYEFPKGQDSFARNRALIIEFAGRYGIGSAGNDDGIFMEAVINTALQVWFVEGMVLDFRNLSYEWGNAIGKVLLAGKKVWGSDFPTAIVVSELCRKALETAGPFYRGHSASGNQTKWLFDDMDSALSYIQEQSKEQRDSPKSNPNEKPARKRFKWRWH